MKAFITQTIARVGICGLSPWAPGTVGSLFAAVVFWFLREESLVFHLSVIGVLFLLGTWACHEEEKRTQSHDSSEFVIDEVVGFWITVLFVPPTWVGVASAFFFFRLFDIWKPFPIRWLDQHVKGGLGVMVDDVAAGVVGGLALFLLNKTLV